MYTFSTFIAIGFVVVHMCCHENATLVWLCTNVFTPQYSGLMQQGTALPPLHVGTGNTKRQSCAEYPGAHLTTHVDAGGGV